MGASLLLLAAAASAAVADAPGDDAVYLPPQRPNRAAWRLYVYDVPWRALNISASAQARYQQMTTQDPPPAHDEGGLYHSVVSELPRLMPRWEPSAGELAAAAAGTGTAAVRGSSDKHFGEDVLFLLPLSPYHLCKAAEHPGTDWGTTWAAPKGSIPASIQQSTISAERDGLRTVGITCATYERAIDWLAVQPPYRLAPERHVFVHVLSHALRQAFRYDLRVHGGARSTYSRMGAGIVVTAEDRRYDWFEARECGHFVPAPYYSPPFFLLDHTRTSLASLKQTIVVESGPRGTACHRYDNRATPVSWACYGAEMRYSRFIRMAAVTAISDLAAKAHERTEARPTVRSKESYDHLEKILRGKAAMYASSKFCLILSGDSAITTRIFSAVQGLCIPVFVFDRDFLPFGDLVPWKNISLRVHGEEIINFERHGASSPNPLLALLRLEREQPELLLAMQASLERARWHLTWHKDGYGVSVPGAAQRPSAGAALVHHLVNAGATRQALLRATGGDARSGLRCTDERLRRVSLSDVWRAEMLLRPWPRMQKSGGGKAAPKRGRLSKLRMPRRLVRRRV